MVLAIWKEVTDNDKAYRVLLAELLIAFHCINLDYLVAKLHASSLMKGYKRLIQKHYREPKNEVPFGSFIHPREIA